jgi:glucose/arabinose dehydrogenase
MLATGRHPSELSGCMAIGQHGSWNRSTPIGYKVVFVPFENGSRRAIF